MDGIPRIPIGAKENFVKALKDENDKLENQLVSVFKALDKDKSGYLDQAELILAAKDMGVNLTAEAAQEVLEKLDKDSDKKVSFEEFSFWWKSGRKLFGQTLKNVMMNKIENSVYAKQVFKGSNGTGKIDDMSKIIGLTHFGLNKEEKPKLQAMFKMATFGPEYNDVKKTYFSQYTSGGIQAALVLTCKNVATAVPQIEKMVNSLVMMCMMMSPSDAFTLEEIKPVIKTRGSSVVLNFSFLNEEESDRKKAFEALSYIIPLLKIGGQSLEFKVKLATDLNALCKEKKSIAELLAEGLSIELRTNVLRKNIDFVMQVVNSAFPEYAVPMRIIIKMLLFGTFDTKVKFDDKIQQSLMEDFFSMFPELKIPFADLKEMGKEKLKEKVNYMPPLLKQVYDFIRNQLESLEIAGITDEVAAVIFAVLPGLDTFLSLD